MLVVGTVAVWAKATVLQSDRVAALAGDAIAEPEVQAALAGYLADQVQSAVDLETKLESTLPAPLARFAPPIAAAANAAVERALEQVIARPQVQEAITTIVERAHARAMRLLQGDGLADGINVENGEVSLNLLPLVGRGLTALQSYGLLDNVDVPDLSASGDPAQQVDELSAALGRDLPAGFGQLVVYRSETVASAQDSVQTAQRLLVLAERAVWLFVVLALVLIAATILVSPRRWRAALVLGVGMAGAMSVVRSAVREVVCDAGDLGLQPGAKAAIRSVVGGASQSLLRARGIVLLAALIVIVVAMLRRRTWRNDLVLVAAVALGVSTIAVIGVNVWGLVVGILLGVAVPFVAHWLLPARPTARPEEPVAGASEGP